MSMNLMPDKNVLKTSNFPVGLDDALFNTVDDGVVVGDINGRILFSNSAVSRMNDDQKMPSDPDERMKHYKLKIGDSEFPMSAEDLPLLKVIREGSIKGHEVILVSAKGLRKNLVCNGRALFDENHSKVGALLVLHDATRLRLAENHESSLIAEKAKLLHINAELERFSSVAAHDLKSPLNSITQFADILKEDFGEKLGSEGLEILNIMSNAGHRLRQLIDDLLVFARSGQDLGAMSKFETKVLAHEVLAALQGEIQKNHALIEVGALPAVTADRLGLGQVFQNLISNALKYTSEKTPVIQVSAIEQDGFAIFKVSDNGIGIRKQDQKVVFDLFTRVEGSEQKEGTGLGLPICKRIVECHGGKLWLISEKNEGTTIYFSIPISSRDSLLNDDLLAVAATVDRLSIL